MVLLSPAAIQINIVSHAFLFAIVAKTKEKLRNTCIVVLKDWAKGIQAVGSFQHDVLFVKCQFADRGVESQGLEKG